MGKNDMKKTYEAPFIEIIPTELDELLKQALSGVADGYGGYHDITEDGDDEDHDGMGKGWYDNWEGDWSKEYWD